MDGFDIEDLDEVIHGRVRLGIMAFLSSAEAASASCVTDCTSQ